jgi:general secretion pathway protein D
MGLPVKDRKMNRASSAKRVWKLAASTIALLAVTGCAAYPNLQARPAPLAATTVAAPETAPRDPIEVLQRGPEVAPETAPTPQSFATPEQIAALIEPRRVQVSLPPQPLPQFIDTVFGEILRVPYSTGPGVADRRDIISLRGPDEMDNTRLFAMAQMALAQYGLGVAIDEGGVRIVQDTVLSGRAPSFIMARSSPDTPQSSRPVMQFFSVASVDVEALLPLLEQSYPNRGSVRFTAQPDTNTLLISGSARDVAAAASIVRQLDQPHFANGQIARIEPVFMSTEQLADTIVRALAGEGYRVNAHTENVRGGVINVVPLEHANQVLVFANDARVFERALYWARRADRAEAMGNTPGLYIYNAVHMSAEELGALISQSGSADGAAPTLNPPEVAVRRNNGVRVGPEAENAGGALNLGAVTIDTAGNRILFHGTAAEFARLRSALVQLDAPQPQVLVELTIAEVTLTDETRFGVEWFLEQTVGGDLVASTLGGSVRQPGGLGVTATHAFSRATVEAALNAFASNRNLNILSTPRVFTRSGRTAEILIGTDVPIITSQRAADNQTGGDTDVLQTVQYRQTGIILNVRPIVLGEDRIDITLYQEVSTQQPNTSAAIASPLILNRSVATQISLQEGMTAVIGGLIQDNYSREQRGIPGLKDIPLLGAVFRSEEVTGDKVELVILVTPYIVRSDEDIADLTDAMTGEVNRTLRRRGTQVYTLYPWRMPFAAPRNHRLRVNNRVAEPAPSAGEEPTAVPPPAPPAASDPAPADEGPTVLTPEPPQSGTAPQP